MIFDLGLGEGITWVQIQNAAELVRGMLEHLGFTPFLKTSGGEGLLLDVPLHPAYGWDTFKNFAKVIIVHTAGILPDRCSAKSGPSDRQKKIFGDYLRNGPGRHYSLPLVRPDAPWDGWFGSGQMG